MPYTGDVTVGGAPEIRETPALRITKLAVGPMENNAYLLESTATGELLLVDAANEAERLLGLLAGRRLSTIVTTHRHRDHWQALVEVTRATGARTLAGAPDAASLPVPTDRLLSDGDRIDLGDVRLDVISLVGHTPGSVALRYDEPGGRTHLFTGDSLFPGGPGKTSSPEDFTSLMNDLESKIFGELPDDTWVYPGHGRDTTLGVERPQIPDWRSRGW